MICCRRWDKTEAKVLSHPADVLQVVFIPEVYFSKKHVRNCHEKKHPHLKCQVVSTNPLQVKSGINLDNEIYRSCFVNIKNSSDGASITMERVFSCDYHLCSNQGVVLIIVVIVKVAHRQRRLPGNVNTSTAYSDL